MAIYAYRRKMTLPTRLTTGSDKEVILGEIYEWTKIVLQEYFEEPGRFNLPWLVSVCRGNVLFSGCVNSCVKIAVQKNFLVRKFIYSENYVIYFHAVYQILYRTGETSVTSISREWIIRHQVLSSFDTNSKTLINSDHFDRLSDLVVEVRLSGSS